MDRDKKGWSVNVGGEEDTQANGEKRSKQQKWRRKREREGNGGLTLMQIRQKTHGREESIDKKEK